MNELAAFEDVHQEYLLALDSSLFADGAEVQAERIACLQRIAEELEQTAAYIRRLLELMA